MTLPQWPDSKTFVEDHESPYARGQDAQLDRHMDVRSAALRQAQAMFEMNGLRDFAGNPAGYGALMQRNGAEVDNLAAHAMMRGWQGPVTSMRTWQLFQTGRPNRF